VVGTAAVLCDPTDTESLAAALAQVLESRSLRDHLKSKGIERARRFTPDQTAARVLQVIEQAAGLAA
jgi:glycosyltransferase involved in cell wall biosynthesis